MFEKQLIDYYDRNYSNDCAFATVRRNVKEATVVDIDLNGNFKSSAVYKGGKDEFCYIPCTIKSEIPSSNAKKVPHPFFNYIKTVVVDGKISDIYLKLLHEFNLSVYAVPETIAIEQYLQNNFKFEHIQTTLPESFLFFNIVDSNAEHGGNIWKDQYFGQIWTKYYLEKISTMTDKINMPKLTYVGASIITGNNEENAFNLNQKNNVEINYVESHKITHALEFLIRDSNHYIKINDDTRDRIIFFSDHGGICVPHDIIGDEYKDDDSDDDNDLSFEKDESIIEKSIVASVNTEKYENEELIKNHDCNVFILELASVSKGCCSTLGCNVLMKDQYLHNIDFWKKTMTVGNGRSIKAKWIANVLFDKADSSSERNKIFRSIVMSMINGRPIEKYITVKLEKRYSQLHGTCDFSIKSNDQKMRDIKDIETYLAKIEEYNKKLNLEKETIMDTKSYRFGELFESLCQLEHEYNKGNNIMKLSPKVESMFNAFKFNPFKTTSVLLSNKMKFVQDWYQNGNKPYIWKQYEEAMNNAVSCEGEDAVSSIESFIKGRIGFRQAVEKRIKECLERKNAENKGLQKEEN